jgi:hypothetical protein
MSPLKPGNMFELDGSRRAGGVDTIQMCSDDGHTVLDIQTGDSFMLVDHRSVPRYRSASWRILFGGHIGTIYVTAKERDSLRLVSQA